MTPSKELISFVENIEFSDNTIPKREIKDEKGFNQEVCESSSFNVKPKLEQVEASENIEVKIENDPSKEIISFVENIEFSDSIMPKNEIKEEEGRYQEVWKSQPIEQKEAFETSQAEIRTEPEEFFSVDDTETLCTESFVCDNVPPENIEEQIVAAHEKERAFECSLCTYKVGRKEQLNRHIAIVHEKEKLFKCFVLLSDDVPPKIIEQEIVAAAAHEKKKPFECSLCPRKFGRKGELNVHIHIVHEKKKAFKCSLCTYKCGHKSDLNKHIACVHEKKQPFKCSLCPRKFGVEDHMNKHIDAVHEQKKPNY